MKAITIKIILMSIILFSCNNVKKEKTERENEPDVYNLEESDNGMNNAIEKAKQTFNKFETVFKNDTQKLNYYSIKQSFPTPDGGSEHIWIGQINLVDDNYKGVVGNEPINTKAVKLGDVIVVDKKSLSDWMIVNNSTGKTKGGYTIRVIRDRMSSDEKKEFDRTSGLIFE